MKNTKGYGPYISGILVSLIFGFSFMFTKNSLDLMNPLQILAFRFAAAAILLSILLVFGVIKINIKGKKLGGLLALAFMQPVVYFIFETIGIKLTTSSEAGMMMALIPVIVTILGAIFLKEKPTPVQAIFVFASVCGVILIVMSQGTGSETSSIAGILALLGAVLSAAIYNILSRKMSFKFKPVEITFVMMWMGAIVFNMLALMQEVLYGKLEHYYMPLLNLNSWVPVLYLGILSSVGAFFMVNYMLSKLPASQSSVFSNLTTVVSILAGVFIRGEAFYWTQAAGGIMILLGVWGTNYFGRKAALEDSMQKQVQQYGK